MNEETVKLYRYWLRSTRLNSHEKRHLLSLNPSQREQLFKINGTELNFGTSGIRALTGLGPKKINVHTLRVFAEAYTRFLLSKSSKRDIEPILISYDNRENGRIFAESIYKVLEKEKIHCLISLCSIPTPVLAFYIKHKNYGGGIMITASHNPQDYNGFKLYGSNGGQLSQVDEQEIRGLFTSPEKYLEIEYSNGSRLNLFGNECFDSYVLALQRQIRKKLGSFYVSGSTILRTIKFLFSSHHGTSSGRMLALARMFGAQKFKEFYWECTPTNAFPPEEITNPEEPQSFKSMEREALSKEIDYLVAHDPDSDRGAIGEWDGESWNYFTGNEIAVLLASFLLELNLCAKYKINLKYRYLVTTYVSGDFIDRVIKLYSLRDMDIRRVNTGFKSIGREVERCIQENQGELLMAFEEAIGGLYFPQLSLEKDGFQQTILSMYLIAWLKFSNLEELGEKRTLIKRLYWLMWKTKCAWVGKTVSFVLKDNTQRERILDKLGELSRNEKELKLGKFSFKIQLGEIPNLFKFQFANSADSWIKARFSGTEPKFKLYFNLYSFIEDKEESTQLNEGNVKEINWTRLIKEKRARLNYVILVLSKLFEKFLLEDNSP